jgi:soluble lytic murein transglycosylase
VSHGERTYHLALRILRHFLGLARSAPPAVPRTFWEAFYPIGWRSEVNEAAARAAVDPYLVAAVVREESSYNAQARSRVGARGLMQLMPDTAHRAARLPFRRRHPRRAGANLELGPASGGDARRVPRPAPGARRVQRRPDAVRQWWQGRRDDDVEVWVEAIPFDETRHYVKRVMLSWEEYRRIYGSP